MCLQNLHKELLLHNPGHISRPGYRTRLNQGQSQICHLHSNMLHQTSRINRRRSSLRLNHRAGRTSLQLVLQSPDNISRLTGPPSIYRWGRTLYVQHRDCCQSNCTRKDSIPLVFQTVAPKILQRDHRMIYRHL
jgi:hypothetical protein